MSPGTTALNYRAEGGYARPDSAPVLVKGGCGSGLVSVFLFCGDLLVNVMRPSLHYYIDDLAQAHESIRKLSGLGVETLYPGHGKPFPLSELPIPGRRFG